MCRVDLAQIQVATADGSLVGLRQTAEQVDDGRLARARRANQGCYASRLQSEAQMPQGGILPILARINVADVVEDDGLGRDVGLQRAPSAGRACPRAPGAIPPR